LEPKLSQTENQQKAGVKLFLFDQHFWPIRYRLLGIAPSIFKLVLRTSFPMQIIILGMHRSGTSAVGHLLEALGFEFGPRNFALKPRDDNPKGFWEREDVVELNDKALAELGARWLAPGKWKASELSPAFIKEFDRRAAEIIAGFPVERPWFLKDPRMCLTAPLWEKHFDDPIYLITYRDPIEVSLSLWSREQLPQRMGIALWERYLGEALNDTRGKKRLLIRYNDLVSDPKEALLALISGIQAFGAAVPCDAEVAARKLEVDRNMRHHQRDSLALDVPLTPSQEALNRRFLDGSILESSETVDVSGANRQLMAYPAAVEGGELQIREGADCRRVRGRIPPPTETEKAILEAQTATEPGQWLALAAGVLDSYRLQLEGCACETMDALEEARLFGLHLKHLRQESELAKSQLQKFGGVLAGNDQAIAILSEYCSQISSWNPLRSNYRRAKRGFAHIYSNPGKFLLQRIVNPELSGEHVPSALKATEALLGDMILGRLVFLPGNELRRELHAPSSGFDETLARLNRVIPLLKAFQCALEETANRVRNIMEQTELFAAQMERTSGEGTPGTEALLRTRAEVRRREEAIRNLLGWGVRLSAGHPLDPDFHQAKRQFNEYQKGAQAREREQELDSEVFRSMIPTVREAAQALDKFVASCDQTTAGLKKLVHGGVSAILTS
jgi:hypothetical protein